MKQTRIIPKLNTIRSNNLNSKQARVEGIEFERLLFSIELFSPEGGYETFDNVELQQYVCVNGHSTIYYSPCTDFLLNYQWNYRYKEGDESVYDGNWIREYIDVLTYTQQQKYLSYLKDIRLSGFSTYHEEVEALGQHYQIQHDDTRSIFLTLAKDIAKDKKIEWKIEVNNISGECLYLVSRTKPLNGFIKSTIVEKIIPNSYYKNLLNESYKRKMSFIENCMFDVLSVINFQDYGLPKFEHFIIFGGFYQNNNQIRI